MYLQRPVAQILTVASLTRGSIYHAPSSDPIGTRLSLRLNATCDNHILHTGHDFGCGKVSSSSLMRNAEDRVKPAAFGPACIRTAMQAVSRRPCSPTGHATSTTSSASWCPLWRCCISFSKGYGRSQMGVLDKAGRLSVNYRGVLKSRSMPGVLQSYKIST
jgi:hypothetical protein